MTTVMSNAEVFYRGENGSNAGGGGDFESASIDDIYSEDDEPGRMAYETSNEWDPVGNILLNGTPSPVPHIQAADVDKATVYLVQGTQTVTAPNYQTVTITKTFEGSPTESSIIVHPPVALQGRSGMESTGIHAKDLPGSLVGFIGIFFRLVNCDTALICPVLVLADVLIAHSLVDRLRTGHLPRTKAQVSKTSSW
jgi:hypothetical protein